MSSPIRAKLAELQEAWRNLQTLSRTRKETLNMAYTNHKFIADLKELELWVADTIKRMASSELPTNILEAKAALELHHERKVCFKLKIKMKILYLINAEFYLG